MLIEAIIIPADESAPLRRVSWESGEIDTLQQAVGGAFDAIDLVNPDMTLWVNDNGLNEGLTLNRRATLFLWVHHPSHRQFTRIVGDVVITGGVDSEGVTQTLPDVMFQLFFDTLEYKLEVFVTKENEWRSEVKPFDDWVDAYNDALFYALRYNFVGDLKVTPV